MKESPLSPNGWNIYGALRMDPNERLEKRMLDEMKHEPFMLTDPMRKTVDEAILGSLASQLSASCGAAATVLFRDR